MSDKAVEFYAPTDRLTLGGNWIAQEDTLADSFQRAQGLKANGDESARKLHDGKTSGTTVYECHLETGSLTLPKVNGVYGGYLIDSLQLVYQAEGSGFPRLTVNWHQHDSNVHVNADMNKFTTSLVFPARFGIPRSLTKVAGGTGWALNDTATGMKSLTYTLSCTHLDENESGSHLAGEGRDGVEKLDIVLTGIPSGATPITLDSGWDELNDQNAKGNTVASSNTLQYERHIARDT